MKIKKTYQNCKHCKGFGKVKVKPKNVESKDIKKMLRVMRKFELNQTDLANILGVAQPTVSGWFRSRVNPKGTIKADYFKLLKSEGYK